MTRPILTLLNVISIVAWLPFGTWLLVFFGWVAAVPFGIALISVIGSWVLKVRGRTGWSAVVAVIPNIPGAFFSLILVDRAFR